jgi:hypothetical protein
MYIGFNIKINIKMRGELSADEWSRHLIPHLIEDNPTELSRNVHFFKKVGTLTPDKLAELPSWIEKKLSTIAPEIVLDVFVVDDIRHLIETWLICQIVKSFEELSRIYAGVQNGYYIPDYSGDTTFLWAWIVYVKGTTTNKQLQPFYTICMEYLSVREHLYIHNAEGWMNMLSNGEVAKVALAIYRNGDAIDAEINDLLEKMCLVIGTNARPVENQTKTPDEME